jgi:hypothetical protein
VLLDRNERYCVHASRYVVRMVTLIVWFRVRLRRQFAASGQVSAQRFASRKPVRCMAKVPRLQTTNSDHPPSGTIQAFRSARENRLVYNKVAMYTHAPPMQRALNHRGVKRCPCRLVNRVIMPWTTVCVCCAGLKSGDLFGERTNWGRSSPQRASLEAILDETRSCFAQEV